MQEVAKLKKEFIQDFGEAGLEVLQADQLEPEQLTARLTGVSLFAQHKLIIIKNLSVAKDLSDQFLAIAPQVPEEIHVVLVEELIDKRTAFYKALKKHFTVTEYGELAEHELLQWIQQAVQQGGGSINVAEARLLMRHSGGNQTHLQHEIDKLVAYQPQITQETIELLVEKQPEETVFQLLDASLSGRTEQALTILESLERAHEDPFAVANMLIWQAHIVAITHAGRGKQASEIAKDTKLNSYVVQKSQGLASRLSPQKLRQIIKSVADMDIKLKSTTSSPWRLLEQTILSF